MSKIIFNNSIMYSNLILNIGSNKLDKMGNIQLAVENIARNIGEIKKKSSYYKSQSWGFKGSEFVNISVCVSTKFDVFECLKKCQNIESKMGRRREGNNDVYLDRVIDIDIIFFNNDYVNLKKITIPHPKYSLRNFVLMPTSEIIPNYYPPFSSLKMVEILERSADEIACFILK